MLKNRNIYLIGPMGAGKTTLGRQLANHLNLEFYDSDQTIEDELGANIAWIFELEGETGFRRHESNAIKKLTQLSGIVLATGGGAILHEDNRESLKANGVVIYLYTTVIKQLQRITHKQSRPLLIDKDPETVFTDLYSNRESLYRNTADLIYDTTHYSIKTILNQIIKDLQKNYYF